MDAVMDRLKTDRVEKESTEVIAFRLPERRIERLETLVGEKRVVGVHSSDQFARWIVEQYLEGRMVLLPTVSFAPVKVG